MSVSPGEANDYTRAVQRSPSGRVILEAIIALLLFGCIPVTVKLIAANPFTIGVFRLAVATVGLFLILAVQKRLVRLSARDVAKLAVIGAIFFGHWLTYFISIKISSASIGAIGLSSYGIHLLLLGALFGRHRLQLVDVVAVLIAITGAVILVPKFDLSNATTSGLLLAVFSALLYATLPLLHQRWSHLPSGMRALGQFFFALLLFALFLPRTDWNLRPLDWGGLLVLAIGSTLIGHSLWVRVTTRLSSQATSVIYYGNLPFALLLSHYVLTERLGVRSTAGAVLIVIGSLIGLMHQWRRNTLQIDDASVG
jgi:drug/metabolite transporter (DMT)-like permease